EVVCPTEGLPELEAELGRRGLGGDGHELVVRRSVARGGRSRAFVAGQLVPVGTLAELFAGRLEISSQHDSQSLRRPEVHGLLLDRRGGLLAQREAVAAGGGGARGRAGGGGPPPGEERAPARPPGVLPLPRPGHAPPRPPP